MSGITSTLNSKGLGSVYYEVMEMNSSKIAQIDAVTGEEQTYGELLQRCIGAALAMKRKGLRAGDFISICSLNHLDVCVPYIASLFTGVITASVDPTMTVPEMVYLLNLVGPKMVFVSQEAVSDMEEVLESLETKPLIVVFGPNFDKFVACRKEFKPRVPTDMDETALVAFSSGTTGKSKGICHSHRSMLADVKYVIGDFASTVAGFSTTYWMSFYIITHRCIFHGNRRIVFPRFDTSNPWPIFEYKIDYLFTNPLQALTFLEYDPPDHIDLGNVKYFAFGGNHVSEEQILKLRARFPKSKMLTLYGQSELFGNVFTLPFHSNAWDIIHRYPTCVGTPKENVSWKIVDIETQEILGPNQCGELIVKADFQFKGYHNRDSSETFDSEGWLKTGDLFYYNEEMFFFVVDRIKESFKYQAHHIIPNEIESVLVSHPAIAKAVVLGLPHQTENNHPMAVVELNHKAANVSEEEVIKYVEKRVADKNRLRGGVRIMNKIPLTVTDKVNRFKLRQMVINGCL